MLQDVAVQTTYEEPTQPATEAEWPLHSGCLLAVVLSLVLWAIVIAWIWWVAQTLFALG